MKNKYLIFLALPLLLMTSCDSVMFKVSTSKEVAVYNLDLLKEEEEDISHALQSNIHARFVSGRGYVPYLTLRQYASLYAPHFADDAVSEVTKSGSSLTWTVYRSERLYFVSEISFSNKEVLMGGNLEAAFKDDDNPMDLAALNYGMRTSYEGYDINGTTNYATYSFKNIKLDYFNFGGEIYVPLSFLDLTYSFDSGIYFYYNYNAIYSSHDADAFDEKTFKNDGASLTVNTEMEKTKVEYFMPSYLKEFNANMFFYMMNNFYGFSDRFTDSSRSSLNAKPSIVNFCKKHNLYTPLFSSNANTRAQAYSDILSFFDDNHTAVVSANKTWGEDSFSRFVYSTGCRARSTLRNSLKDKRDSYYTGKGIPGKDIIYSNDGKTAMYMFDSFVFGKEEEVFNAEGKVNYETATQVDTFFNLIDTFQKIKARGGVENIVLDISTNGGGVLGVMMKLLSLMSKDNSSCISYLEGSTKQVVEAYTVIDSNEDGVYSKDDVFGEDFNFYILTSDCSFSCGNAFPCYAKTNKFATIIGQKSGGGECAVAIHFLPNSQYVYHSSNLHLGYYNDDNRTFTGFEDGAEVDIPIENIDDFYNIELLNIMPTSPS